MGSGLLVAGTTSDAGKSVVVTGICRSLARRGLKVAPFKAQNMSNNSMVTSEGAEIGRAQWIQAVAARAIPEAAMNPVLLKPGSDRRSHVVVLGRPAGSLEAGEFAGGRQHLADAAFGAFDDLRRRFDVVVCEGAGSAAEINLRDHDYVNMGLAQHGSMPTVVVGDIDRGGVFASMYGTLALLDAADQQLIRGFVINKFRGDVSLLKPGLDSFERVTGRPVLGVLPWQRELWLDSEDSLALTSRPAHDGDGALSIAVVMLPRVSNFTDVDALCLEPDVRVRFVDDPRALAGADVVIVPGTRATLADLAWLRSRGLDTAIVDHARRDGPVLGICGGFQMLGTHIDDPHGVEGVPGASATGLGLLPVRTEFAHEKVLRLPRGTALEAAASGYEIHHGRVTVDGGTDFLGGTRVGSMFGTMWHGALEGDAVRRAWLREVAAAVGREIRTGEVSFPAAREARIEALADLVDEHLDMDALLAMLSDERTLPVLRGTLR
ncbi:cobyric acid synthase [Rhodococcus rhodochrous]|uniref:cobyric acid synthase n=1 Tax=Rhodococcus rhodochrous TaxID=1829 RepID=UPI00132EF481|nr:cobyric acid synthase [Rhodococcus rhodochrous]QHG82333.1 cobyric acid synthase [Rhodococcus rhodochrous]QOH57987.1 cobyric acid synthase CobQ [Rhodococcus rhodochrous]